MYYPLTYKETEAPIESTVVRRACLVEGCPCKDARMVSRRKAAFHAAIARSRGETALRTVAADPTWQLPRLMP